ncbi:MAG: Transglutaminase-like enzyme, putative cysteine protease [uncultured Aureispira sp.]|uniref:Transglutaminase-like enzyme, putative cysteine protease n=1 Tax=uncultured Aureispira sp. TaxID=1331704 RepID=A0A6S6RZM9_9BACT|nr:MAG: Transglutaminase-like enzyme, putative cysteine protease [uncultured Aureispira sp.]
MNIIFLKRKYYLLILFAFPLALMAQEVEEARQVFPEEGLVLTNSLIHFKFKKEKKTDDLVVVEKRAEEFLSLKGNQKFSYVVHYDDYSSVDEFETSALVNDEYYQSNDIFHSDIRMKYANYSLRQKGLNRSIKTKKTYKDIKYLTKVYLTSRQSALERTVKFTIPKAFEVDLVSVNFEGYTIEQVETEKGGNREVEYKIKNLAGFSKEESLPGASYIYPHVLILPKRYDDGTVQSEFFNSLDALYAWYAQLVAEVENKPEELNEIVETLTASASSEEAKIKNIFYWVQDNIRYIAFEDGIAGYQPENCQTVFFNRYGDCKGMANLMKEMLKLAGFDARLVWLGTKSVATNYSTPCLASDNHMICAVKQGADFLYLDGTEKYTLLGAYAERIQNQEVLIEDGASFIRTKIPVQEHLKNTRDYSLRLRMTEKNTLVGAVQISEKGEAMSSMMYRYNQTRTDEKEESLKGYLALYDKFISIENMQLPSMDRSMNELVLSADITIKNKVSVFDDELYLYLDPYHIFERYDLGEDRQFPFWTSHKHNDKVRIEFELPEGYELSSLPKSLEVENADFKFNLAYKLEGNNVFYDVQIQIPNSEITQPNIAEWNKAIKSLKAAYDEPIILIKK